jgi:N-acetyltransferase
MPFDLQPTLPGKRVVLRPLREEDFPALYAVASDPLIWEQHPVKDRYKEDVFAEFFRGAMQSGGAFAIHDASTDELIGSSRYDCYDEAASEVEIGWTFLARSHWGSNFNHEMKRLMLDHAFGFVDNVVFLIGTQNIRSQTAIRRIGAVLAGKRINPLSNGGAESLVFRITRAEYAERQQQQQAEKALRLA